MTNEQLSALFCGLWRDSAGDLEFCLRTVYEAGQGYGERTARRRGKLAIANSRRLALSADAAKFLRRRWDHLFTAVAERHDSTPERLLLHAGRTVEERRGTDELCLLLRTVGATTYMQIGAMLGRNHASVHAAVRRQEARIAARPELREELLAAVEGGRGDARIAAVSQ